MIKNNIGLSEKAGSYKYNITFSEKGQDVTDKYIKSDDSIQLKSFDDDTGYYKISNYASGRFQLAGGNLETGEFIITDSGGTEGILTPGILNQANSEIQDTDRLKVTFSGEGKKIAEEFSLTALAFYYKGLQGEAESFDLGKREFINGFQKIIDSPVTTCAEKAIAELGKIIGELPENELDKSEANHAMNTFSAVLNGKSFNRELIEGKPLNSALVTLSRAAASWMRFEEQGKNIIKLGTEYAKKYPEP